MNCAITAHHVADWVWGDFVKGDAALKAKIGINDKNDFIAWIDSQTVWYGLVQSISNGSRHFIRENAKGTQKVQGYGMDGFGQGPFGMSHLARLQEHGVVHAIRGRHQVLAGLPNAARSLQAAAKG
jgi:hypothetical protein